MIRKGAALKGNSGTGVGIVTEVVLVGRVGYILIVLSLKG
jgi:hypothetical protein